MRADVEEEDIVVGEENKFDAVVIVYPECPRAILLAVQFVRAERRMKWIFPEERLFLFCRVFQLPREFTVMPVETRLRLDCNHCLTISRGPLENEECESCLRHIRAILLRQAYRGRSPLYP